MKIEESFENGKYTVIDEDGKLKALRYGEVWQELTGDNLIRSMLFEVERLRAINRVIAERSTMSCTLGNISDKYHKRTLDILNSVEGAE